MYTFWKGVPGYRRFSKELQLVDNRLRDVSEKAIKNAIPDLQNDAEV